MKYLVQLLLLPLLILGMAHAGTIDGEVTDSQTATPVGEAKIVAMGFYSETGDTLIFATKTDEQGKFKLENLPAARYYLYCKHPDYKPGQYPSFMLQENETRTISFMLELYDGPKPLFISGQVFSTPPLLPAIIPIENAVVHLKGRTLDIQTMTKADGSYKFENIEPGKYLIWAAARGHLPMEHPDTLVVEETSPVINHDLYLIPEDQTKPVHLAGFVYDATVNTPNYPVYPAEITLTFTHPLIYGPIDTYSISVTNNPDGSFVVKDLLPAIYDVRCTAEGYYTEYIRGVDLSYGPDTLFIYMLKKSNPLETCLSGKVLNSEDNTPIQSATVTLSGLGPNDIAYISYTDERGIYHFRSVPPGTYELRAVARGFEPSLAETVEIEEGTCIKNWNIYLDPLVPSNLATMHGGVYNGLFSSFEPVYPACISLFGSTSDGDSLVYHTRNNPDGSYKIPNIIPGKYTVRCSAPDFQSHIIRDFPIRPPEVEQNFFLLPKIYPEKGWISGTVTFDASGIPVAGAILHFMSENEVLYRTSTSKDGKYKAYLPVDEYFVSCTYQRADSSYYYQEYYDDVHSLSDATPVMVYPNEVTAGIDFGIPDLVPIPSVVISGTVTDNSGNPLANALVRALQINPPYYYNFRDNHDLFQTWTDDNGNYKIEIYFDIQTFAPAVDGFIVSAEKPGYKMEFYKEKPTPYLADILWTTHSTVFEDINFTLDPAGMLNSISGTVLSDTGLPIPYTFVIAANANTHEIYFAFADRSGGYTLNSLASGYYYLLFTAPGHIPEFYDNAHTWEEATPVLANGTVTGIDAELMHFMWQLRHGLLAGVVKDNEGRALQGALVCIKNSYGEMVNYGLTDAAGGFSINGLDNGLFEVTVSKVNYATTRQWLEFDSDVSDISMLNFELEAVTTNLPDAGQVTSHIPVKLELLPNYPNPFNPETRIAFGLPEAVQVRLAVYDILGREVKELINNHMPAGTYQVTWDGTTDSGRRVSSGIYFYALIAGEQKIVRKMILNK